MGLALGYSLHGVLYYNSRPIQRHPNHTVVDEEPQPCLDPAPVGHVLYNLSEGVLVIPCGYRKLFLAPCLYHTHTKLGRKAKTPRAGHFTRLRVD